MQPMKQKHPNVTRTRIHVACISLGHTVKKVRPVGNKGVEVGRLRGRVKKNHRERERDGETRLANE